MTFEVSAEEQMIRDFVRELAQTYGRAYWLAKAERGEFPAELWAELGRGGYLGTAIPEEYGGSGLGLSELYVLAEELSGHGLPLLMIVVSAVMGTIAIVRHGTEAQKRRYLPALAAGSERFCFAITEPDAGTNSFRIATTARRDGDHYVVKGQKTFISGAGEAQHVLLVVRTTPYDEVADKRAGISLLAVDTSLPGIGMQKIDIGIHEPEHQWALFFDDVRVPRDGLIGPEGGGMRCLFDTLNPERIIGAATGVGLGRFVIEKAVAYARERRVFDVPIGSHQGLQHPLAIVKTQVELAALMGRKAAWLFDQGLPAGAEANMAKFAAAEAAIEACDLAIEVHGGNGFTRDYDVITVWPYARLLRTAPISREMILNYIGEHVLGLAKSY